MVQCRAAIGPGRHPPAVGLRVVDVDAGVAQHRHRHRDMRRRGHRLAGVHDGQPVGERGARQQQPGDELRRGRGVDLDRAAGHRAAAVDPERQAVAVDVRRPARAAPSSSGAMGRARACSSPSNVTVSVLSAATGGTKRSTVPARPQSTPAPGCGAMRPPTVNSLSAPSTVTPSARSAPIIRSVSRLRSAPLIVDAPCGAASAASTSARLVCDFEPGTVTVAWTGVGVDGAGQVLTGPSCLVG